MRAYDGSSTFSKNHLEWTKREIAHNYIETLEKPLSWRLMENVHMQGFRNPEE
jgi:hypothetical protein